MVTSRRLKQDTSERWAKWQGLGSGSAEERARATLRKESGPAWCFTETVGNKGKVAGEHLLYIDYLSQSEAIVVDSIS